MQRYQLGDCTLNCDNMSLAHSGKEVQLPKKVFELLYFFISSEQHIVSKDKAIEVIWQNNEGVGKKGLANAIWTLRKAFKDLGVEEDIVRTLPKVGYQLTVEVVNDESNQITKGLSDINSSRPVLTINPKVWLWVSAVLIIGLALTLINQISKNNESSPVAFEVTDVTNFEGVEEQPALSNDGRYMAFLWRRAGQTGNIYVKDLNNPSTPLSLVVSSKYEVASPAWSLGDDYLAFVAVNGNGECEVKVKQIVTNTERTVAKDCYYQPFRRVVSWSQLNPDVLIYAKELTDGVAIYQVDINNGEQHQVSFPQGNETHFAPHYTRDDGEVIYINERSASELLSIEGVSQSRARILLENKVTLVDFDLNPETNTLYVNYADSGKLTISTVNLDDGEQKHIQSGGLISNLIVDSKRNTLFFSEHISKEYIAQHSLNSNKILRRVSSSYRDMYGRYNSKTKDLLFLSNRTGLWALWISDGIQSRNLSGELGNATVPAISPSGEQFAVAIRNTDSKSTTLYMVDFKEFEFSPLPINGLRADNLSWSKDGSKIYFHVADQGIFSYQPSSRAVEQVTFGDEQYLIEGPDDEFYVSRLNKAGIWRINMATQQHELITEELDAFDIGAFYAKGDAIVYLQRTESFDLVKAWTNGKVETIKNFPAQSVRKFFGLAAATDDTIIATLKVANEADIKQLNVVLP